MNLSKHSFISEAHQACPCDAQLFSSLKFQHLPPFNVGFVLLRTCRTISKQCRFKETQCIVLRYYLDPLRKCVIGAEYIESSIATTGPSNINIRQWIKVGMKPFRGSVKGFCKDEAFNAEYYCTVLLNVVLLVFCR